MLVGIKATGAMQWSWELLVELGIECRVGHPAKIRAQETRKQIGGMHTCCCSCSARIASRRFGCPRPNSGTCEPCCGTGISG